MLSPERLFDTLDATWPAANVTQLGPWILRDGAGGGQRVAATTTDAWVTATDLDDLPWAARQLFMIRTGAAQDQLDHVLDQAGYQIKDPCIGWALPLDPGADLAPAMTGFTIWPPLAVMTDLWAEGGIDAARCAVMGRVKGPKTAILGRVSDRAAGVAFVGLHHDIAMIHAVEVTPDQRRKGAARQIMLHAFDWARAQGARTACLVTTRDNLPANTLYASLGMERVAQYHYRVPS